MNCEQVEELLAAFSIDALPPDEMAAVRDHLQGCRLHDEALAGLGEVAGLLPLAVEEREPPPALRSRLLDAFDADVAARRQQPVQISEARERRRWWQVSPAFAYGAAAALLIIAIGLAAWNIALQAGDDDGAQATVVAFEGGPGTGDVRYLPDEEIALIDVELPELEADQAYQAWMIDDETPASMGLIDADGVTAVEADLSDQDIVAITIEPAGGSSQPTTNPFLTASLE
jgi:anti-sigma-K factor RskA